MTDGRDRSGRIRRRLGRAESAIDTELRGIPRSQIGAAARAALRVQAHAVDLAEASGDAGAISTATHVYLELRHAEGLRPVDVQPADTFAALLAELGRPGAGASDTAAT